MADFLSKIFLLSPQKSENNHLGEASLMQGARFNKMQKIIEKPVYSHLALINQTMGGAIIEPLENNSTLPNLDNKEFDTLSKMEHKYETLITQLKNIQSVNINTVIETGKISDLKSQIKKLNIQIMQQANRIIKHTYGINKSSNNINKSRDSQRNQLKNQVNELMRKKQTFDSLLQDSNSLDGQHQDKQNELDAVYLHYIVWFIAATTLGVITVRQLSK